MRPEYVIILMGWIAVSVTPILIAWFIWTTKAKRQRLSSAKRSRISRRMICPSEAAEIEPIVSGGLRPEGLDTGLSQIEFRLKLGDRVPIYMLSGGRIPNMIRGEKEIAFSLTLTISPSGKEGTEMEPL